MASQLELGRAASSTFHPSIHPSILCCPGPCSRDTAGGVSGALLWGTRDTPSVFSPLQRGLPGELWLWGSGKEPGAMWGGDRVSAVSLSPWQSWRVSGMLLGVREQGYCLYFPSSVGRIP